MQDFITRRAPVEWWSLLLVILIAAVWLYHTPYSASDLPVTPDAVEYAVAPLQFLETGRYEIMVEGRGLPPRYPPWFPIGLLLPAYALLGHKPGNAIFSITLLAVAGVGFAWAIGRRISSPAGGVLAALAMLFTPTYTAWASQVMTDVPSTALMLGGCLLFLQLREKARSVPWYYFLAGTLVAVTTLFRPVFAAMLLPFLWAAIIPLRRFLLRAAALLTPMAGAAAANFAYNAATFGSMSRNGYKLWVPVPVDYPWLMFGVSNLPMNASVLAHTVLPVFVALSLVAYVVARWKKQSAVQTARNGLRDALTFFVFTTTPIVLFHLFYFFPGTRFYLPVIAGAAVMAGALLGLLVPAKHNALIGLLLGGVLALAVTGRMIAPDPLPLRRIAADRIRAHTPDNATIISAIEPAYLERLAASGSSRRIVPLSRDVEYASKLLAWKRIDRPEPAPVNWRDSRCLGLIRGGAQEAVSFVASEQLDVLAAQVAEGRPVFLETSATNQMDAKVLRALQERFITALVAPYLYQLRPLRPGD